MENPNPKDAHILEVIDTALEVYDSEVRSWHVLDHELAMDAVRDYEAWLTKEQNG